MNLPKKTTILILILAVVTALLVFIAVIGDRGTKPSTQQPPLVKTTPTVAPTARLYFVPEELILSAPLEQSVDVTIDTQGKPISGAQIELSYDPTLLSDVAILPATDDASVFGPNSTVLFNSVDEELGRISLAIAVGLGEDEKIGIGKVATITFTTVPPDPNFPEQTTELSFLPKTAVTTLTSRNTILKEALSLPITIISAPPPPSF